MDIANLHAFIVVAQTASFSQAAEQLHLTQPAVSKRIAALEENLNTRLFDRLGRTVLLTEAGYTLLPRARRILADLEDSRRALQNLAGDISGALSIATSHHIGLHRLPPVLRTFTSRYTKVQLDMHFMDSELACEAVARGDAELGIVTLPPAERPPLSLRPLWTDRLVVVISHDHPLAGCGDVSALTLSAYPAILPGTITFTRGIIDRIFEPLGLKLKVAFSTNYLETIKMMVSVGLGWSLLPENMVDAQLRALRLEQFHATRQLGIVRHTGRTLSNAGQAMIDILALENLTDGTNQQRKD